MNRQKRLYSPANPLIYKLLWLLCIVSGLDLHYKLLIARRFHRSRLESPSLRPFAVSALTLDHGRARRPFNGRPAPRFRVARSPFGERPSFRPSLCLRVLTKHERIMKHEQRFRNCLRPSQTTDRRGEAICHGPCSQARRESTFTRAGNCLTTGDIMEVRFSDGINIQTSGPYRIIRKSDGLYVVGQGILCAVDTRKEGNDLIRDLNSGTTSSQGGPPG